MKMVLCVLHHNDYSRSLFEVMSCMKKTVMKYYVMVHTKKIHLGHTTEHAEMLVHTKKMHVVHMMTYVHLMVLLMVRVWSVTMLIY